MSHLSIADLVEIDVDERLRLVQALWDSIAETPEALPLTDAERAEIDRRLADYQATPDAGSRWPDVKARLIRGG